MLLHTCSFAHAHATNRRTCTSTRHPGRGDNDLITVGERTNVQDGCVLHSDDGVPLTLGKGVTVGHMVMLHGCSVGDNSLIGISSTILNNTRVGANCIIGAYTLLPENKVIPDNSLVMGSPGKVVKTLSDEQVEALRVSAQTYVNNKNTFAETLRLLQP